MLIFPIVGWINNEAQAAGLAAPGSICATVRIMPLGDSITTGKYSGDDPSDGADEDDIGYRKTLKDSLFSAGYTSDFVGSMNNGQAFPGFTDTQHEGHNGYTDSQVATHIYNNGGQNWLSQNPPDMILLHIGTNGLNPDPGQVEDILDEIDEFEQDTGQIVLVILARIINRVPPREQVTSFNNSVETMAMNRQEFGGTLFVVDMEDGAGLVYEIKPAGDMIDDLHPWETGYDKMAAVWKSKITQTVDLLCNNNSPIITPISDKTNNEGDSVSLQVQASDADDDPLTFSAAYLPPGLNINPSSGLIGGTIPYEVSQGDLIQYNVVVTVRDGKPGVPSTTSFTWTVNDTNRAPVFSDPPGNQSHAESQNVSLQFSAIDPDGDGLTYTETGLPPGLGINPATGLVSGSISYTGYQGSDYSVQITATDNGSPSLSATTGLTWSVSNTNRPPEFTNPPGNQSHAEGITISLPILASDPDPEDTLTYSAENLPPGLAINQAMGLIGGVIDYNASPGSPYQVLITVTDNGPPTSMSDTVELQWVVSDVNGSPQVTNPGVQIGIELLPVSLPLIASDPDGDSITFAAAGLPPGLEIGADTGLITGVISAGATSESPYSVSITVTDNATPSESSAVDFSWEVKVSAYGFFLPLVNH